MISYDKYRYFVYRLLFGWLWILLEMIPFHLQTMGLLNVWDLGNQGIKHGKHRSNLAIAGALPEASGPADL